MKKLTALTCVLFLLLSGCTLPREPEKSTIPTHSSATENGTFAAETTVSATENSTLATEKIPPAPADPDEFVRVSDYIPDIQVELKYATTDNFTAQVIYDFQEAYLRYGTVEKLQKVQDFLRNNGLSLKIWDAFRPISAQFALWQACPDPNFVADPNRGYSAHSRGNTLDVTIVDKNGVELEMPTAFDDFSALADRDYSDCSLICAENARLLQSIMEQNGFSGYQKEWWHFTDTDTYEVEASFSP